MSQKYKWLSENPVHPCYVNTIVSKMSAVNNFFSILCQVEHIGDPTGHGRSSISEDSKKLRKPETQSYEDNLSMSTKKKKTKPGRQTRDLTTWKDQETEEITNA